MYLSAGKSSKEGMWEEKKDILDRIPEAWYDDDLFSEKSECYEMSQQICTVRQSDWGIIGSRKSLGNNG